MRNWGSRQKSSVIASLSRRSSTPSKESICTRKTVSSYTSRFSAFTSDSPRFTFPPGSVQSFNPRGLTNQQNVLIRVFDPSHDRYFLGRAQSGGFRGYFGHVFAKGSEVLQSKREAGVTLISR